MRLSSPSDMVHHPFYAPPQHLGETSNDVQQVCDRRSAAKHYRVLKSSVEQSILKCYTALICGTKLVEPSLAA